MQKRYTKYQWEDALMQDPGLDGPSLAGAAKRLNIGDQELQKLILNGKLNISYVVDQNCDTFKAAIPERDIQRYTAKVPRSAI